MKKNAFLILITFVLCLVIAGCGDDPVDETGSAATEGDEIAVPAAAVEPLERWVPSPSFNSLIWGRYSAFDTRTMHSRGSNDLENFLENMPFEQREEAQSEEDEDAEDVESESEDEENNAGGDIVSILPITIKAGPVTLSSNINDNLRKIGYDLIEYGVYSTSYENIVYETAPYRIVDNLIIIYTQWSYEYIDPAFIETTDAIIEISHENTIVYEFCFDGRDLILSRGGAEVRLTAADFIESNALSLEHHPNNNSDAYNDMNLLIFRMEPDGSMARAAIHFDNDKFGYNRAVSPLFSLSDDGTMSISWAEREVSFYEFQPDAATLWCRYIWSGGLGGGDGFILIDSEGNAYPYQLSNFDYRHSILVESLSVDFSELSDSEIDDLLTAHANVMEGLQGAFEDADIAAEIDELTGRITMDTAILFAVGDATISAEGRAYLDEFLDAYAAVILDEDNAGTISEIVVEGHTDSDGTYEDNLILSENRANAVIEYCRSRQPGLAELMTAVGMSYNQPVYGADGMEDKDASRRVVFRFILSVD